MSLSSMHILFGAILFFGTCQPIWATQIPCAQILAEATFNPSPRIIFPKSHVNAESQKKLKDVSESVFSLLSDFIDPDIQMPVVIANGVENIALDFDLLALRFDFSLEQQSNYNFITAHEVTHFALQQALVRDIESIKNYYKARFKATTQIKVLDLLDRYDGYKKAISNLKTWMSRNESHLSGIQKENISQKLKSLKLEFSKIEGEYVALLPASSTAVDFFVDRSWPYHELFADLVPELLYGDGSGQFTKKSLEASGVDPKNRDFSNAVNIRDWHSESPHGILAPSRNILWKKIKVLQAQNQTPKEILQKVYSVILAEMSYQLENIGEHFNHEQLNQRFIGAIEKLR